MLIDTEPREIQTVEQDLEDLAMIERTFISKDNLDDYYSECSSDDISNEEIKQSLVSNDIRLRSDPDD